MKNFLIRFDCGYEITYYGYKSSAVDYADAMSKKLGFYTIEEIIYK